MILPLTKQVSAILVLVTDFCQLKFHYWGSHWSLESIILVNILTCDQVFSTTVCTCHLKQRQSPDRRAYFAILTLYRERQNKAKSKKDGLLKVRVRTEGKIWQNDSEFKNEKM